MRPIPLLRGSRVLICALAAAMLLSRAGLATSFKQPGFSEAIVFSGLVNPTSVRFLPDGSVLVIEKSGLIKKFVSLTDPNPPTVVADLRVKVHNFWDRGLLGIAGRSELHRSTTTSTCSTRTTPHRRNRAQVGARATAPPIPAPLPPVPRRTAA